MSFSRGLIFLIAVVASFRPHAGIAEWKFAPGYSVEEISSKATDGDADAQATLGNYYLHGQGVSQNIQEAIKWYKKAADQNSVVGLSMYAFMLDREGQYIKSTPFWLKAAQLGSVKAQIEMGVKCAIGMEAGIAKDFVESAKWFQKAAEGGDSRGQRYLGLAYTNGIGVPQDFVQAHKWYNISAASNDGEREEAAAARDKLASKMTAPQIAEAQKLAREWKPNEAGSPR